MAQPTWITASGSLGTFTEGSPINYTLDVDTISLAITASYAIDNSFVCTDCSSLVINQPIVFSGTAFGGITIGTTYYVSSKISNTKFVISSMPSGAPFLLSTASGYMTVTTTNTLQFEMLNGEFPSGSPAFSLSSSGVIAGTPTQVSVNTTSQFTVRVSEYYGSTKVSFSDRTFSITISGTTAPTFITPSGALYSPYLLDSTWDPYQILFYNPDPNTTATIRLVGGSLPPGLEISSGGLIQGYASQTSETYNFTLAVESESGSSTRDFSITINAQTALTRTPSILNSQPPSFDISIADPNYAFYVIDGNLGVVSQNNNFLFKILGESFDSGPISYTRVGTLPSGLSDNIQYSNSSVNVTIVNGGTGYNTGDIIKILGSDIDGIDSQNDMLLTVVASSGVIQSFSVISGLNVDSINTEYSNLLTTNVSSSGSGALLSITKTSAGWISGSVATSSTLISSYSVQYVAVNTYNMLTSDPITFNILVVSQTDNVPFDPTIIWNTNSTLGTLNNSEVSELTISATSLGGVELEYAVTAGSLPPGLTLLVSGEIIGKIAFETQSSLTPVNSLVDFTFEITASNTLYPLVSASKTFTITVDQVFDEPYENLYMRALLTRDERIELLTLLYNSDIIPDQYVYRPNDPNFGVAKAINYQHMYGVPASTITEYIAALNENFYWRNITLGPVKTAIARDDSGNIIYEVVYSEVIDNLVNEYGISVDKSVVWPSNSSSISTVYPASLQNMREQMKDVIGQDQTSRVLPRWMTSQQANGNILGFIQAWVIAYTKPGYSEIVKNNITSPFGRIFSITQSSSTTDTFTCDSTDGFYYNMRIKFTGDVFGGVVEGAVYYIQDVVSKTEFSISSTVDAESAMPLTTSVGLMQASHVTWNFSLNTFNYRLDRFEVSKCLTDDYNPSTNTWSTLPSSAVNDDQNDMMVFFTKKNILI